MTRISDQYHTASVDLLKTAPPNYPVVALLRHSIRDELPPDGIGYTLPITEEGKQQGIKLGQMIGASLQTLHSSPLARCLNTAEAINEGAGLELLIVEDRLLGDPGAYVIDGELAWSNWAHLGSRGVMRHLVSEHDALPGMARPGEAARRLVLHMLESAKNIPGVHIFVSHDNLVMATAARLLGEAFEQDSYPNYLEAAIFWQDDDGVHTTYRGRISLREPNLVCLLARPSPCAGDC